jgi:hypothetical protein
VPLRHRHEPPVHCENTSFSVTNSQYSTKGDLKESNLLTDVGASLFRAIPTWASGNQAGAAQAVFGALKDSVLEKRADAALKDQNTSNAKVVLLSGCKDDQTVGDGVR